MLGSQQSFVTSTWPASFRKRRIGAFKLQFSGLHRYVDSLALVVVSREEGAEPESLAPLQAVIPYPVSDVLVLAEDERWAAAAGQAGNVPRLVRGNDLAAALADVRADYVLFLDWSAEVAYTSAVDELLGYLLLDPQIGVVAGKVLNHEHRICCSSYVFHQDLRLFGGGRFDADFDGYWYKNRLAHNALAVPNGFFMTRRRLLVEHGIESDPYGAYAVPDYCLRLRDHAIRTVYNPWAVCLSAEVRLPATSGRAYEAFKSKHARFFGKDPYYLGYS